MAGTLFGVAYSQYNDLNGIPQVGAKLYIYAAGTQTPSDAFKDFALTVGQEHPHPIVTDSMARFPQFWLADGSYSFRVTDSDGVTIIPYTTTTALGPSTGDGGGGSAISSEVLLNTGDILWRLQTGVVAGFVRVNGRTIGSATSGAAERANSDVESLFTYLWTNLSDTVCPVSGGRGASAAADWSANKTIALPDMKGRGPFGLDDMGGSAASRLTGATFASGNSTTVGSVGGESGHTLLTAEMPSHTHTNTASNTLGFSFSYNSTSLGESGSPAVLNIQASGGGTTVNATKSGSVSVAIDNAGGGGSHNVMSPFMLGTWYMKI